MTGDGNKERKRACHLSIAGALLAMLAGCSGFDPGEPAAADSAVAEVLVDLQILEARQRLGYAASPAVRDSVLSLHGIEERQLDEALASYAEHPEQFVAMYAIVLRRLEAEQYGEGRAMPREDSTDLFGSGGSLRISRGVEAFPPSADSTQPDPESPGRVRPR